MKKCPECRVEYKDDSMSECPVCHAHLETVGNSASRYAGDHENETEPAYSTKSLSIDEKENKRRIKIAEREKNKNKILLSGLLIIIVVSTTILTAYLNSPGYKARKFIEQGDLLGAAQLYSERGMKNKAGEIWLSLGKTAKREKQYEKAIGYFKNAGDYPGAEDEIKECNYLIACGKVAVKDFASARTMFRNMGDYRDSGKKYMRIAFRGIKKGSVVQFGTYQQKTDSDTYGPEPIEWIVLAIKANKALLLSRYALEYRQYNSEKEAVTWEDCSMRDWLNDEFYNTAFNETEKKYISLSYSVTPGNAKYKTYGGKPVQDQVFLLSFEEAKQYLPTPANRLCKPTEYAAKRNVDINQRGTCPWWLRTPGAPSVAQEPGNAVDSAMFVDILGTVIVEGCFVNSSDQNGNVGDLGTARPAIWVLINY